MKPLTTTFAKLIISIVLPIAFITVLSSACGKQDVQQVIQQQDQEQDQCKVLTYQGFDASGNEVSRFEYYYTGNSLDSVLSINNGIVGAKSLYQYSSPENRHGININASSGMILSTTDDLLDLNGNLLESVLNDNSGHMVSKAVFTYRCD